MDHPYLTDVQRITLLGVPIDIVPDGNVAPVVRQMADEPGHKTIVFLTYTRFMRAQRDSSFRAQLHRATLVLPVSRSLDIGCRFLHLPEIVRHYPFDFVIRVLGALEETRRSLYLLGDHHVEIQTIAANMRTSFPRITLVGRHTGFYGRDKEKPILEAIRKATPTILLIGPGIPSKERWAFRQGADLPVRISIQSEDTFRVMSGRKRRASKAAFRKGTHEIHRALINPLKIFRVFSYFGFGFRLLWARFQKSS